MRKIFLDRNDMIVFMTENGYRKFSIELLAEFVSPNNKIIDVYIRPRGNDEEVD